METQEQALATGTTIDNFEIVKVIGVGGFGVTYQANDTSLQRKVAIKEYFPSTLALRSSDGSTLTARTHDQMDDFSYGLQRFLDEARTLAQFRHPNIVQVLRYLEANSTAYLVMELEEGEPLESYLARNSRLPEELIVRWILPILQGLESVHEKSYLHRDIKPANIFLRFSGEPLLLDFGSARLALEQQRQAMTVVLTPGYAPVEQYAASQQGPWTDLYSVGATMFRAMCGTSPPEATKRITEMHEGNADPALKAIDTVRGEYTEELIETVNWLMQPRARDRPRAAREVLERLKPMSTQFGTFAASDVQSSSTTVHPHEKTVELVELEPPTAAIFDVDDVEVVLTEYLGPIAKLLVKAARKRSLSRGTMVDLLAEEIENEAERAQFKARLRQ